MTISCSLRPEFLGEPLGDRIFDFLEVFGTVVVLGSYEFDFLRGERKDSLPPSVALRGSRVLGLVMGGKFCYYC